MSTRRREGHRSRSRDGRRAGRAASARRVILVAYDGAQGLDILGPAEVFASANRAIGRRVYDVIVATADGEPFRVTSGVTIVPARLAAIRPRATDTALIVGGDDAAVRAAVASAETVAWAKRAANVVERIGSVCSGAFVLAVAGILDGRRAATHWSACRLLADFRPQVTVDADAIFVKDGAVWTSAGVTTGIDMALAMVEADHGRRAADAIAARLVLYARRPGFQSQFSDALVAQTSASDAFERVLAWAREHVRERLYAGSLARRAGLSPRTFHRRCREQFATTPAKLIERLRVEQARTLLATTQLSHDTIAIRAGFGSPNRMARAFKRTLGVAPRSYAALQRGAD